MRRAAERLDYLMIIFHSIYFPKSLAKVVFWGIAALIGNLHKVALEGGLQ
jgi:hypothetical protein